MGFPPSGSPEDFHLRFRAHARRTNAALSGLGGLLVLTFSPHLARWLGIPFPPALDLIALLLILYALLVARRATEMTVDGAEILAASSLGVGWVIGAAALSLSDVLTPQGMWLLIALTPLVLGLALLQLAGLCRLRCGRTTLRCRYL